MIAKSSTESNNIQLSIRTSSPPKQTTENAIILPPSAKLKDTILNDINKENKTEDNILRGALIDTNDISILEKYDTTKATLFICVGILMFFTIGLLITMRRFLNLPFLFSFLQSSNDCSSLDTSLPGCLDSFTEDMYNELKNSTWNSRNFKNELVPEPSLVPGPSLIEYEHPIKNNEQKNESILGSFARRHLKTSILQSEITSYSAGNSCKVETPNGKDSFPKRKVNAATHPTQIEGIELCDSIKIEPNFSGVEMSFDFDRDFKGHPHNKDQF